jgi:hypothetical protein
MFYSDISLLTVLVDYTKLLYTIPMFPPLRGDILLQQMFFQVRLRESEMQALHEERSKREALERKLQEETMLREELVQQQIKMRDHQVKQV